MVTMVAYNALQPYQTSEEAYDKILWGSVGGMKANVLSSVRASGVVVETAPSVENARLVALKRGKETQTHPFNSGTREFNILLPRRFGERKYCLTEFTEVASYG
jgi:hypothetical protein